jgi:hypothetical protein
MLKPDTILVYHWHAWEGFLISHLTADHCRLEANHEDDITHVARYLSPNIRAVLLQINLSRSADFPARRRELVQALKERNILVLNTEVEDISKRNLHRLLEKAGLRSAKALENGPADQFLFVKSDLNWGGAAEQRLPDELREKLLVRRDALLQSWDSYYTVRRGDMRPELWSDTSIVIEEYIENAENSFYRIYVFGDAVVVVKAHSEALIKKISGHCRDQNFMFSKRQLIEQTTELPAGLQKTITTFITRHALAYCCLDIVHDTKNYVIVDLNLTPYAGVDEQTADVVDFLRQGAHGYIKQKLTA